MQRQSNNGWAACIRASLHGQLDHDRGISCAIASNFDADDADADNDADDDLKKERVNADDPVQAEESTVEIIPVDFCSSDFGDCLTVMMVLIEINHQFITDISDDDDIDDVGVTNEGGNVGAESETHLLET